MSKSIKRELTKKILHPKSRKAMKLSKQSNRLVRMEKVKLVHHIKKNLIGEKLLWFQDHLEPDVLRYTPDLTMEIIEMYLSRFDEELEQIKLKHSIGNRKNRQHASREDIIKLTKLQEEEEFSTCGLEIPDLLNPKQLEMLRNWEGELRFLQNFKLKRYSSKQLEQLCSSSTKDTESAEMSPCTEVSENVDMSEKTDVQISQTEEPDLEIEMKPIEKDVKVNSDENSEISNNSCMEVDSNDTGSICK